MDSVDSDMTDVHFSHFENKILIACKINTEVMELLSCYTIVITNMESAKLILGAGKCIRTQGWISSPNQQKQRSRFFLIQGWYLLCLISAGCRTFWQTIAGINLTLDLWIREVGEDEVRHSKYSTVDLGRTSFREQEIMV